MLTALEGMGARGQESLLELARTQHLALPKGDVAEVVASRAALMAPEGFQLSFIDKVPLLHHTLPRSTPVLLQVRGDW